VSQELANTSFQMKRVAGFPSVLPTGAKAFHPFSVGAKGPEFFLQAIDLNDPFHGADADIRTGLLQLLGDHFGRGVRIEKAMADDQPDHLLGPAVVGFRSATFAQQSHRAPFPVGVQQLIIALLGITELAGGRDRTKTLTLAFENHGQLACDLVTLRNRQSAVGPLQMKRLAVDEQHIDILPTDHYSKKGDCRGKSNMAVTKAEAKRDR